MKILFISSFHPGGQGEIGAGEAISGDSLKRFLSEGYDVDVYVISPETQRANSEMISRCNKYIVTYTNLKKTLLSIVGNATKGALVAPWRIIMRMTYNCFSAIGYFIACENHLTSHIHIFGKNRILRKPT